MSRISGLSPLTQPPRFDIGEHSLHQFPEVSITQRHQAVVLTVLSVKQREKGKVTTHSSPKIILLTH